MSPWLPTVLSLVTGVITATGALLGVQLTVKGNDRATGQRDLASQRDVDQRELSARREEWWRRFTWAADLTMDESATKRSIGLQLVKKLTESELAGKDEYVLLESLTEQLGDLGRRDEAAEVTQQKALLHRSLADRRGDVSWGTPRRRHALCLAAEIANSSVLSSEHRIAAFDVMRAVLNEAGERTGADRARWEQRSAGDGELVLLPDFEPAQLQVIDNYVRELSNVLARHNEGLLSTNRMQVRLAMHYGVVVPTNNGYEGPALVDTFRLLAATPLREAMVAASNANLGVISTRRSTRRRTIIGSRCWGKTTGVECPST